MANDYAGQILESLDYVVKARMKEYKFDETIICTVVDDTKASEGLYVVSDGTIKFDAYSESVDYKVDQAVRVNVPKGDYSQKKYIVGKAVSEKNGNQPIVYSAPSTQILDLTGNVVPKGVSGTNWSIFANGEADEKQVFKGSEKNNSTYVLVDSFNLNEYQGLIYDTLYLKADFKTIFSQRSMCAGGYGLGLIATMKSKDSSGKQNTRTYYLDSKQMFGNPYNYLISSSQETKFFIGKDDGITNIGIYLYQTGDFQYRDSAGNVRTYEKSLSPVAPKEITVSNIYIGLGVDLTQVEDNKVEIQCTDSPYYNDPKVNTVDNTKIVRLQWYNKDENNQYIGFSDGEVLTPQNRKFLFIGDSYGVGQNSETWHGWPYYTALSLGFDKPEYGGMYYSATDEDDKPKGVARYVNTNPNWDQWIAIAQQNVGFVGKSTYVPVDNRWIAHDPGTEYNFAKIAEKAADFLKTASFNQAGNNMLPTLPSDDDGYYTNEIKEKITDIVIAGGWSDRNKEKSQIAAGIIDFIRAAVNVTRVIKEDNQATAENEDSGESSVQRIYFIGSDSCGSGYSNSSQAKENLKTVYSYYKSIIDDLNKGNEIEYHRENGNQGKQRFTTKDGNQLKIIYADGKTKNCPELIFYDIHEVLSDDDFKNDKGTSDSDFVRGKDDNIHPAASGYQKIGKEIARRVRSLESELDYAKRLFEHNRIVAQMKKDGVPDDYAGFELNARYEEIRDLKTTLISLIDVDLFNEIHNFKRALNGKADSEFTAWLNELKGTDGDPGLANNIILAFNGSELEIGLLDFYKNGLDFAKKVQDGLVTVDKDGNYWVKKEDGKSDSITKPFGLRKIENKLLGRLSNSDEYAYLKNKDYLEILNSDNNYESFNDLEFDDSVTELGYLITVINNIETHMTAIKTAIKSDVNLSNIYNGYKIRIDKIKNSIIKEKDRFKALSLGHLYSINSRLDNSDEAGVPVKYYTSWYLFEDPLHPKYIELKDVNGKNGQGLLTSRIKIDEDKVSLFPKHYYPDKFDKQSNLYSIYWYYYRDGYKAGEGENNLGGDNWCEITDPGRVNGKPRFNVINTNDNIGLPDPIKNETTGKWEYPKKLEVDDENGYLTISFSKERPDVKEEKIKAVLIYNHEKYESNVLTFENKDPAAGPELTNNIQIVHGSNSQTVYPLYGVDNNLIKASDENTKRQLKVQYLNERGEPESGNDGTALKGASIYWYVPTQATMLRTEDVDLVNVSGNEENFTKGSMVKWDFEVEKTMVTENGKDSYVDSCILTYTTERPIFKGTYNKPNNGGTVSDASLYVFKGETCWMGYSKRPDGGNVNFNSDNTKAVITYQYNYSRNDEHKKFYICVHDGKNSSEDEASGTNHWNVVTPLSYGGITYSISEDGNYIVDSNNDKYYISSNNKITLEVDLPDENDQKGYDYYYKRIENVDDLIFTYRIKNYYSSGSTNNTVKCKVVKGNQTLESSINLDFNSHGSNGTNYSLVIKPLPLTAENIKWNDYIINNKTERLLVNKRIFEVMLFDYENKQISFKQAPTVSLLGGGDNKPQISLEPKTSNETGVLTYITNEIEIPHYNYHPWFLKVEAKQPWPLDSNELVVLETQYPIPLSNNTELTPGPYQGDIPTTIVYDSLGGTPSYYKNPLALYDKNGELIQNCKWSILYFNHQKNDNGTTTVTRIEPPVQKENETNDDFDIREKAYRRKINFLPKLQGEANGVAKLVPSTMYVDDDHKICAVLKCGTADNDTMRWLQPLLICQNRYPSAMLNNWDGGLEIDEDENIILANIVGAGKKEESDNSFSGVLMGEVENININKGGHNTLYQSQTGMGLYGFNHGAQSFGFNVDGTAFIGKAGGGRIAFDGTHGFIYSGNWLSSQHKTEEGVNTDSPFHKDTSEVVTLNRGTDGMAIDLQNGHIDAYNFRLSSANIELNSNPAQDEDNYLYIGPADNTDYSQPHIRYTKGGALEVKVDSLALTGVVGGQNLLNNTEPLGDNGSDITEQWSGNASAQVFIEDNDQRWISIKPQLSDKCEIAQYLDGYPNHLEHGTYVLTGKVRTYGARRIKFYLGKWGENQTFNTREYSSTGNYDINCVFDISQTSGDISKMFVIEIRKQNGDTLPVGSSPVLFYHLKLEKANTPTGWQPSEWDNTRNSYNYLDQDKVFDKLTNGGATKGIWLTSNQLYINATYISSGILRSNNWNGVFKQGSQQISRQEYENLSETDKANVTISGYTKGTYINLNTGELYIGQDSGSYIRYENGSLKMKVNEFSLSGGAIGGPNLLNNTEPPGDNGANITKHWWGNSNKVVYISGTKRRWIRIRPKTVTITNNGETITERKKEMHQCINPKMLDDNLTLDDLLAKSDYKFSPGTYILTGKLLTNRPNRRVGYCLGRYSTQNDGTNSDGSLKHQRIVKYEYYSTVGEHDINVKFTIPDGNPPVLKWFSIYDTVKNSAGDYVVEDDNNNQNPTSFHHLKLEKAEVPTGWQMSQVDIEDGYTSAIEDYDNTLNQEAVCDRLFGDGHEGVEIENGRLYINGSMIRAGTIGPPVGVTTGTWINLSTGQFTSDTFKLRADTTVKIDGTNYVRTLSLWNDPSAGNSYFFIGTQNRHYIKFSSNNELVIKAENFVVHSNGDVEVKGKITATSGEIGKCIIDNNGNLKVPVANIAGEITAGALTVKDSNGNKLFSAGNGSVSMAGWTVKSDSLTKGEEGTSGSICLYTSYPTDANWRLLIGSKFKVDREGNITANGGSIGSWSITKVEGSNFTGLYSNQMSGSSGYQIYLTPKGISYKGYASAGSNANWTSISWGNIIAALASYTDSKLW